jgi:hypothetical protein
MACLLHKYAAILAKGAIVVKRNLWKNRTAASKVECCHCWLSFSRSLKNWFLDPNPNLIETYVLFGDILNPASLFVRNVPPYVSIGS